MEEDYYERCYSRCPICGAEAEWDGSAGSLSRFECPKGHSFLTDVTIEKFGFRCPHCTDHQSRFDFDYTGYYYGAGPTLHVHCDDCHRDITDAYVAYVASGVELEFLFSEVERQINRSSDMLCKLKQHILRKGDTL